MDIYVINLDRRADRLQQISEQLAQRGLSFTRITAIDGAMLQEDRHAIVDRGTEACWRSHQSVFARIADGASRNALILEDDAVLVTDRDWPVLLQSLDDYMTNAEIDVLQLGFVEPVYPRIGERLAVRAATALRSALGWIRQKLFPRAATTDDRWRQLASAPAGLQLVADDFTGGAHCYLLSRRAAASFRYLNVPVFLPVEDFFRGITLSADSYRSFSIARVRHSLAAQRGRAGESVTDSDLEPFIAQFIKRSRGG